MKSKKQFVRMPALMTALALVIGTPASAVYFYKVRQGETLSQILRDLKLNPIYSEGGNLQKALAANPKLSSANRIYPNDRISLPVSDSWNAPAGFQVTENQEVVRHEGSSEVAAVTPAALPEAVEVKGPSPAAADPAEENARSGLSAAIGFRYFRIDAVDAVSGGTSRVLSKLSPDFSASWNLHWDDSTTIRIGGGVLLYSLEDLNANQSYVNGSGSLGQFSVGVDRKIGSRLSVGGAVYFQQEMFFVSQSTSVLKVDRVMIVQPALSAQYDVIQKGNAAIGLLGEARLLLSASPGPYSVNSGSAYRAGIFLRHQASDTSGLEGQLSYQLTDQNTSFINKSQRDIQLKLQYHWGIF